MLKILSLILAVFVCCIALPIELRAHAGGHGVLPDQELPVWTNRLTGESIRGSLLYVSGDRICLERGDGSRVEVSLAVLSDEGRESALRLGLQIAERNRRLPEDRGLTPVPGRRLPPSAISDLMLLVLLLALTLVLYLLKRQGLPEMRRLTVLFGLIIIFFAAQMAQLVKRVDGKPGQSGRPAAAAPFDLFAPRVVTSYDSQYLLVESDGVPDHTLMVGIKAWQQQVPIPQPYYGENAWRIPLNPVVAAQPISAKTALFTGAIALAANGIPIFNALNNRGVDSYSIGELDQFGGHCGRADDYHYHAAPLHIQTKVGPSLPIGYALDGFPLYGLKEPDGATVTGLDELNGHYDSAGKYHYHSTLTYPYINGGMRGVVTVSNDQIVPQPRAYSVRPFTSPLNGAVITGFTVTGSKAWSLEYTVGGQIYKVNYGIDAAGKYYFDFIDPSGAKRTESYTRRGEVSGVSAASYQGTVLGAESIASIFGTGMTTASGSATTTPLPTVIGGTSVRLIDSAGMARLAPLFYVSSNQINFQIPPGTSDGTALVSIGANGAFNGFGTLEVGRVAPGLFTADSSGAGYAAALVYRYRNGMLQGTDSVARFDQPTNRVVAIPIDLAPSTDDLYLTLFGTGLRYRTSLGAIGATIGGVDAQVLYAGSQGSFVGLDQVNLRIPAALAGRSGDVDVVLTIDGRVANTVRVSLKGAVTGISWSLQKLPDTGQTGHFGTIYGEDSDYTINPPSYQTNGDGSVTDRVTGLQWQQGDGGEMSWDGAKSYCESLTLAGRDDWRMPRLPELFTVNHLNNVNPAIDASFTRTTAEYWWAAEQRADDAARAWATNAGGGAGPHPKSETISGGGTKRFHVRCVREATVPLVLPATLEDKQNGTVIDHRSGLVWQQVETLDKAWDEAVRYCEDLTLAGVSDWRLPNLRELRSINDEGRVRPSLDTSYFPGVAAIFWTSSTLVNQTARAWTVDFNFGIASYNTKTDRLRLRCVRGGGN